MNAKSAPHCLSIILLILFFGFYPCTQSAQYIVDIPASKDNTLYEDFGGSFSNGSGEFMFVGRTNVEEATRLFHAMEQQMWIAVAPLPQQVSLLS